MRADHRDLDLSLVRDGQVKLSAKRTMEPQSRPFSHRSIVAMERVADYGQFAVGKCTPDQRHAERNSIGSETCGHSQRGKIHKVHEVRVDAEI